MNFDNAEWKDYQYGECIVTYATIDVEINPSMVLHVTAHYPHKSVRVTVLDAREEPATFYTRAEDLVKKKHPGAIYSYIVPTEQEAEEANEQMWNQIWTHEHK